MNGYEIHVEWEQEGLGSACFKTHLPVRISYPSFTYHIRIPIDAKVYQGEAVVDFEYEQGYDIGVGRAIMGPIRYRILVSVPT